MPHAPETLGQMSDRFAAMASNAPRYERIYNPDGDPKGEFAATREGLASIRSKLGGRAYDYLLARVDENWMRLQSGREEDLRMLKLSFGEMAYFISKRQYGSENMTSDLSKYTNILY